MARGLRETSTSTRPHSAVRTAAPRSIMDVEARSGPGWPPAGRGLAWFRDGIDGIASMPGSIDTLSEGTTRTLMRPLNSFKKRVIGWLARSVRTIVLEEVRGQLEMALDRDASDVHRQLKRVARDESAEWLRENV